MRARARLLALAYVRERIEFKLDDHYDFDAFGIE